MITMYRRARALATAILLACVTLVPSGETADDGRVTLGTFDSRAVAIAYANSEINDTYLTGLRQELEDAQAAGDEARAAELEARGQALQEEFHRQGFSTASVANILVHIQDAIPGIAERAGVDVIVSKWDLVYLAPAAEFVDVTELLCAEFDPHEKAWKWIRQAADHEPLPIDTDFGDH